MSMNVCEVVLARLLQHELAERHDADLHHLRLLDLCRPSTAERRLVHLGQRRRHHEAGEEQRERGDQLRRRRVLRAERLLEEVQDDEDSREARHQQQQRREQRQQPHHHDDADRAAQMRRPSPSPFPSLRSICGSGVAERRRSTRRVAPARRASASVAARWLRDVGGRAARQPASARGVCLPCRRRRWALRSSRPGAWPARRSRGARRLPARARRARAAAIAIQPPKSPSCERDACSAGASHRARGVRGERAVDPSTRSLVVGAASSASRLELEQTGARRLRPRDRDQTASPTRTTAIPCFGPSVTRCTISIGTPRAAAPAGVNRAEQASATPAAPSTKRERRQTPTKDAERHAAASRGALPERMRVMRTPKCSPSTHDFAFREAAVADEDVDRLAGEPVELDHGAAAEPQDVLHGHRRASELDRERQREVEQHRRAALRRRPAHGLPSSVEVRRSLLILLRRSGAVMAARVRIERGGKRCRAPVARPSSHAHRELAAHAAGGGA